jgi:DNA repair protein RadC
MTYDLVCERSAPSIRVTAPQDLVPSVLRYAKKKQEHFLAVTLDGAQQVIRVHIVSIGLLNRTLIHPREVFIRAIRDSAASLILVHNHPSGQLDPSREDREATNRLVSAGELLGIAVLDHLIISKAGFFSFKEQGFMPLTLTNS